MGKLTPPNDKAIEEVTFPKKKASKPVFPRERIGGIFPRGGSRDRLISLSKIRFLLEDIITPPKGRFSPLREKIAYNFTSPREKAGEGHVLPIRLVFPGRGPSPPRYKMMSPKDKFTSPKYLVENKPVFSKERVVEMEKIVRCIVPLRVSPSQRWHAVKHKKFPQRFSRTQKRRM